MDDLKKEHAYEETLMYGHYTNQLAKCAEAEAERLYAVEREKELKERLRLPDIKTALEKESEPETKCSKVISLPARLFFTKIGEHWLLLGALGIIMGVLGFGMDMAIVQSRVAHDNLNKITQFNVALSYIAWVLFPTAYALFSAGIVRLFAPHAAGSGLPEMKTILRGVELKDFLSFRTFVVKTLAITASMGSGLPLGREGSLIHISSVVASLLNSLVRQHQGIYENECRRHEMLAAACAVGVATCFAAPIGGVLFSIEVTTEYFAVRNYWHGFFSAMCAAVTFRLMSVWSGNQPTVTALFKTSFQLDFPYDPLELIAFAVMGMFLGCAGALFVWLCKAIVRFNRSQKKLNKFLQHHWPIYPAVITIIISSITFPGGLGQYIAGDLTPSKAFEILFKNVTWYNHTEITNNSPFLVIKGTDSVHNIFISLTIFVVMKFWMSALISTVPIANGIFLPNLLIGAGFGRMVGEAMAIWFPDGFGLGDRLYKITPGSYAVAGAAAMSGSVTHTISSAVIVCEITGQILHIIPVTISTLIANLVAHFLQPSFYNMVIKNKKLPYLPSITSSTSKVYDKTVEDFMVIDIMYVTYDSTYGEIRELLEKAPRKIRSFPLVDSASNRILIGSIQRAELQYLTNKELNKGIYFPMMKGLDFCFKSIGIPDITPEPGPSPPPYIPGSPLPLTTLFARRTQSNKAIPSSPRMLRQKSSNLSLHTPVKRFNSLEALSPKLALKNLQNKASPLLNKNRFTVTTIDTPPSSPTLGRQESVIGMKFLGQSDPELSYEKTKSGETIRNEMRGWEERKIKETVNFTECKIDQAPFQVVQRTTLHKVQTLFSMLSLNHAYVTNLGRLVGIISLAELRQALEDEKEAVTDIPSHNHNQETVTTITTSQGSSHYLSRDTMNTDITIHISDSEDEYLEIEENLITYKL